MDENKVTNNMIEKSVEINTEMLAYLKTLCETNKIKNIIILVLSLVILVATCIMLAK
jgi:hypothetical protein